MTPTSTPPSECPALFPYSGGGTPGEAGRYRLNSAGYRGEEYLHDAPLRLAVCGCSYTFGIGVDIEDTWPAQFRDLVAQETGITDINLVNLSSPGASNSYIARTVVTQCARVDFDLVAVLFTHSARQEYYRGNRGYNIGPWTLEKPVQHAEPQASLLARELRAAATAYFSFYHDEWGAVETLKNVLWVQSFLQSKGIPHVLGYVGDNWGELEVAPAWQLRDLLSDSVFLFDEKLVRQVFVGSDNIDNHPGPGSARIIAARFFEAYRRIAPVRG